MFPVLSASLCLLLGSNGKIVLVLVLCPTLLFCFVDDDAAAGVADAGSEADLIAVIHTDAPAVGSKLDRGIYCVFLYPIPLQALN